jgi:nicotinamide riboside kinase
MKIGFVGTMSVGKTTLVKALADLPEFSGYKFQTERSKYLRDLGIPLNTDSTIKGQTIFLAERVSELFNDNIITDRTILDVMAFTNLAKSIGLCDKRDFEMYASKFINEYDYIFYVSPEGVDIEDNGVRETNSKYRECIDMEIRSLLIKYCQHDPTGGNSQMFYHIRGSHETRVQTVLDVVFGE